MIFHGKIIKYPSITRQKYSSFLSNSNFQSEHPPYSRATRQTISRFLKCNSIGKTDPEIEHFHRTIGNIRTCRFPAVILDKRWPIMSRITGHHWLVPLSQQRVPATRKSLARPLTYFTPLFSNIPRPSTISNSFHARCLWRFVETVSRSFPFLPASALLTGQDSRSFLCNEIIRWLRLRPVKWTRIIVEILEVGIYSQVEIKIFTLGF